MKFLWKMALFHLNYHLNNFVILSNEGDFLLKLSFYLAALQDQLKISENSYFCVRHFFTFKYNHY